MNEDKMGFAIVYTLTKTRQIQDCTLQQALGRIQFGPTEFDDNGSVIGNRWFDNKVPQTPSCIEVCDPRLELVTQSMR